MTTLRQYSSILIPTLAMLMSIHIYSYIDKLVVEYQNSVNQNYSIVIISKEILKKDVLREKIKNINTINQISTKGSIEQFKNILSSKNFSSLSSSIPFFYQLKLTTFPSKKDLTRIKNTLLQDKKILKVETFLKKYSSFAVMLANTQKIIVFFTAIVLILSFILIIKIIEVWYFEHKNRLDVMKLFGASIYQRSQILIKISAVNSIISTLITMSAFYYLYNDTKILKLLSSIGIPPISFNLISEALFSFGVSFGVSLSIVLVLMIKNK